MRSFVPWLLTLGLLVPGQAAITGQVVDPAGKPVAGARILCLVSPDGEPAASVTAGPDGRFALALDLEALPPFLRSAPAEEPIGTVVAGADGYGLTWASCTRETLLGELRLSAPAALDVPFVDADGRPLAGVAVHVDTVSTGDTSAELPAHAVAGLSAVTDAHGLAHFTGLPRRALVGLAVDDLRFVQLDQTPDEAPRTTDQPVATAEPTELILGATVRGRVVDGRTGRPVAGAQVAWASPGHTVRGRATTNALGGYAVRQLPPGAGLLEALRLPLEDGCAAPTETLTLKAGEELAGQDLTVVDGVPLAIRVEAAGRPVPRAILRVSGPQLPAGGHAVWPPLVTGDDGRCTLRVLPGRQRIRVIAALALPEGMWAGAEQETVDVPAGAPATLVVKLSKVRSAAGAAVRVVDAEGHAVAGAEVEFAPAELESSTTTDAAGRCRVPLFAGRPPGVRARLGGRRSMGWVRADAARETVLTLAEQRQLTLDVLVRDTAGKPLAGLAVTLVEHRGDFGAGGRQVNTNAGGHASFGELEPGGRYEVTAGGDDTGYGPATEPVTCTADHASCPPLALPPADQQVAGWVLDVEGKPVARARVSAARGTGLAREATTNSKGEFRITGLVKGKVVVSVADPDVEPLALQEVETGDESVVLRLKPAPAGP